MSDFLYFNRAKCDGRKVGFSTQIFADTIVLSSHGCEDGCHFACADMQFNIKRRVMEGTIDME